MRDDPVCQDWARAAKARGNALHVSYKNTHETAAAIKGMSCSRAKRFLKNVIRKREIVPFRRHTGMKYIHICLLFHSFDCLFVFEGGIGRKAQCRGTGCAQGRWPKKSCYYLLVIFHIFLY